MKIQSNNLPSQKWKHWGLKTYWLKLKDTVKTCIRNPNLRSYSSVAEHLSVEIQTLAPQNDFVFLCWLFM